MSLVRSNRPNWLRPFGTLFVLSTIFVLTQVISPASAVITSKSSSDVNWIRLDENFPPTKNEQNEKEIIPFFYARGLLDANMTLTNEFITNEIENKSISAFHLTFDIWRNVKKCAKYFSFPPDTITDLKDGIWTHFDRQYPNNEAFRDFNIWVFAATKCEDTLVAIRNLKLSYNRYQVEGKDEPIQEPGLFKTVKTPTEPELKPDLKNWNTYLFDCKTDTCLVEVDKDILNDDEFLFWHPTAHAEVTVVDHVNIKATNEPTPSKLSKLTLNADDFVETKTSLVTIKITATDDSPVAVKSKTIPLNLTLVKSKIEIFQAESSKFLEMSEFKALPNSQAVSSVYLNQPTEIKAIENPCYKFSYFVDQKSHDQFTLSVVRQNGDPPFKSSNRYKLFDFAPTKIGIVEEEVHFCLWELIRDKTLLDGKKVQFLLETKGSTATPRIANSITLVSLVRDSPDKKNEDVTYKFLTDRTPVESAQSAHWANKIPGKLNPVAANNNDFTTTTDQQQFQLHSHWVKRSNKLSELPLRLKLSVLEHTQAQAQAIFAGVTFTPKICDDIMDCINLKQIKKDIKDVTGQVEVLFDYTFDPHPNDKSTYVKLVLQVDLPVLAKNTPLKISLVNFGDPCHPMVRDQAQHKCSDCKAEPKDDNLDEANDLVKSCKADSHCDVVATTRCSAVNADGGCRNNAKNDGFECICATTAAGQMQTWITDKCVDIVETFTPLPEDTVATAKHISIWNFHLDKINQHIYDICYRFLPTVTAAETIKQVTINLRLENIADGKSPVKLLDPLSFEINEKNKDVFDLCLSQLVDHIPETASLVAEIEAPIALAKGDSHFYGIVKKATKPEGKVTTFKIVNQFPKDIMKVTKDGATQKEVISFAKTNADLPSVINVVIFSDWIANEKSLTLAQINKNTIKTDQTIPNTISICRPRTEQGSDCKQLTVSNLGEILTTLGSDKFQLMLHVPQLIKADNPKIEDKKINPEISIWNACEINDVKCLNPSAPECLADNAHKFQCVAKGTKECPADFSGTLCQIDHKDSCTKDGNEEKFCKPHGYACHGLEGGSFECVCPSGFKFVHKDNRCERSVIHPEEKICAPGQCFVDKILHEPFHFLPQHFPMIGKDRTGRELFYAIKSDSKLTITVDDPDKYWVKAPENDVCVRFKYFVAPQAKLSLRFNDQIDLWKIEGIEPAPKVLAASGNDQTGIELSKEVNVCVKALLPLDKLKELTNFHLSFVSQTDNLNEAVAVELNKTVDGHYLHQTSNLHTPAKALRYLSNESPTDVKHLSYQWTANFPDNRWSELLDHSGFQIKKQESDTIETAYLESAWIERLVQATSPVYLNFKVEVDLKDDFNGTVYLIDSDRKPLTSFATKFTHKEVRDAVGPTTNPTDPTPTTKSHTFSIPINVNIDFGKMFKVQFHIRYKDNKKLVVTTLPVEPEFLLKISEINFGDPCINKDKEKQKCYGIVDGEHKIDSKINCIRNELSNGGMSYKCNCTDESHGLSGANCEIVDYCRFKHTISMLDPTDINRIHYSENQTGSEFCAQDGKIATCKRGRFESHKFLCECNDKAHSSFNWYNRTCDPINQCILNPCNFETELCEQKSNEKNELVSDCHKCMPGYERMNGTDAPCVAITHNDVLCDLWNDCTSKDPHMKCIAGPYDLKMCVCPKGFKRDGTTCKSAYCEFPGLHKCSHKCTSIETDPYYQCSCEDHYDRDAATEKCTLKSNAPSTCQECKDAKHKVCKNSRCSCIDNFVESGNDCVPSANYQLKGCPFGHAKINDISGELVCDCANKTSGYFIDDTTVLKNCKLSKTICDSGERGQSLCALRGAGCLLDPLNLEEYSCQCNLGKLFPDGKRVKKASDLRSHQEVKCVDVCDLPYKRNQCASIGAKCNPTKLLNVIVDIPEPIIKNIQNISTEKYCECVTGTFYDTSIGQCVQEHESLSLNLTFRWSHGLQEELGNSLSRFVDFVEFGATRDIKFPEESISEENTFSFVDPIEYAHSLIRVKRTNLEADSKAMKEWEQFTRKISLLTKAEDLLYNFDLIDHHSKDDKTEAKEIGRHVQIVSIDEQIIDGKPNYALRLSVKISKSVLESLTHLSDESEEEMPVMDTAASVLSYNFSNFQIIMDSCQEYKNKDNCVIPYMSVVLARSSSMPVLNEPCTSAETCLGMSNCIPKTGSQFSCECDLTYFELEDTDSFAAKSNGSQVVLKNDRCKSKLLCPTNCPSLNTNHVCIEKDPMSNWVPANNTHVWEKDYECGCKVGFGTVGTATSKLPQCTAVCSNAGCTSNGKCIAADHSAKCECEEGYHGLRCEHAPASVTGWIVAVALLAVLTVVGVGAAIFFWRSSSESTTSHSSSSSLTRTTSNRANQPIRRNSHKTFANLQDMPNQPKSSNINLSHNLDNSNNQFSNVSLEPQTSSEITTHSTTIVTSANNKSYEVRQVEASNQQSSSSAAVAATVVATASSVSSFAKPKDHRLEQIYAEEKLSQKSFSQNSQTDDTSSVYSGLKFTAARGSFISADMNSLDFSRQESEDSLTVNEPFTPSPTSPLSQLTNQQSPQHHATHPHLYQRRSISVRRPSSPHPIAIAEKNELLYSQIKDELRVNQKTNDNQQNNKSFSHSTSSSSSNSLSSDSLSQSNGQPPTIDPPPPPPPAPSPSEESKFTTMNDEPPEPENPKPEISPSSSSSSTSTSSASSHRPSTSDSNNKNLFSDSQEMNQDKFKHVRNKIAAVLRINSFKSYELTKNDDKPLGPR